MRTVLLLALTTSLGCAISPAEERARREALAAEGRALELAADAVEARLLAGEARLVVWNELAARREQVTEVACRVGDAHFQDMARLFEEQAEKGRDRRRHPRAWASAGAGVAGLGGPRVPIIDER
ncbi:MAG TPA: hypothetical protein VLT82_10920 [Myxococcaceae bacterium]|nr:hypothetical protein [Myxococcaceae bacterium]